MTASAFERVRRVVAAGERIAAPSDPLGREARARLPEVTGLSIEGVELALREHLERSIAEDDLARLVSRATPATRCLIVLSANVCTAALRAIAFAAATAPAVFVKASRRDPVVAELIVRALQEDRTFIDAGGSVELVTDAIAVARSGDELHVYGRSETVAAFRFSTPRGVALRGHGAGFGVAVVPRGADLDRFRDDIAKAVIPFDQQGCLSPRLVLVEGAAARATEVARAAAEGLAEAEKTVPRGRLDDATRAEIARYVGIAQALGEAFVGPSYAVGVDAHPVRFVLPPAARVLHVLPENDGLDALLRWLRDEHITAVGIAAHAGKPSDWGDLRARISPSIRVSDLAGMQRPPLDGPVDLRALSLTSPGRNP